MKKLVWYIMMAFLLFGTQGWAEDEYQRKMFQYLAEGLDSCNAWNGNYRKFYDYVKEQHYKSESFRRFEKKAGWKVAFIEDGGYCHFGINDDSLNIKKLPLYPIFEDHTAIIVSFEKKSELNYLQLPGFLRAYYEKVENEVNLRYQQNKGNHKIINMDMFDVSIEVNLLQKDIPLFFKERIWLYSKNGYTEADVLSMDFRTLCPYGFYQITMDLKKTAQAPVFAFQADEEEELPVIINPRLDLSKLPFDLGNKEVFIAPVDKEGKRIFIGSNNNTTCEFYLIWDTIKRKIVYLSMSSGYCLGNEPRVLNQNYLLKYKGNYYILRYSQIRRYAEVLYFKGSKMTRVYHADMTAPEI